MDKIDYSSRAMQFQSKADKLRNYAKINPNSATEVSDLYLRAAENWKKEVFEKFNFPRARKHATEFMKKCYDSAIGYASEEEKKKIVNKKTYANLSIMEMSIKKELQKAEKTADLDEKIRILKNSADMYKKMIPLANYDIREKKDLEEKLEKILRTHHELLEEKRQNQPFKQFLDYLVNPPEFAFGRKIAGILSISFLLASLFFSSISFTGNVIGGLSPSYSRIAGLCIFFCGLIFAFIYLRKK